MSGAEVIGIISGIIAIIDGCMKVYDALSDASSLPAAFRDVAARLPLVQDTLTTSKGGIKDTDEETDSTKALKKVLQSCEKKADTLRDIFKSVIPAPDSPKWKKPAKAVMTVYKASDVEGAMSGILADLQVLTVNHAVKAATREQLEKLIETAAKGRTVENRGPTMTFNNTGSGTQVAHNRDGNIMMNLGSGSFNTGPQQGPFYFGAPPSQ